MMLELEIFGKHYTYPGDWNMLSKKQLLQICQIAFRPNLVQNIQREILFVLLNFSKRKQKKLARKVANLPAERKEYFEDMFYLATESVRFLFAIDPETFRPYFNSSLTRNLVPRIKKYYGPGNEFKTLAIWEFILAEQAYFEYMNTGDIDQLDELFAILYREKKPFIWWQKMISAYNNDPRKPFRDFDISSRKEKQRKIKKHYKFAAYLYFEGCRNLLPDMFPNVFKQAKEEQDDGDDDDISWADVIIKVAQSEHKEVEEIETRNLMIFFKQRDINIKDMKELEKKYKTKKNGSTDI